MNSQWFQSRQLHSFEDTALFIPDAYKEILTALYGDYMTPPPLDEQRPHYLMGEIIFDCHKDYHFYQN